MHNRPRNKIVDAKEIEEKRKKIAKWNELKKQIFEERRNGLRTREQLSKLNNLLLLSPEFYSFWNYRKEIIIDLEKDLNDEEKKELYMQELKLTEQVLRERHTKSYGTWYHRKWCIVHVPETWDHELILTATLLELDNRNFHCWNYREFIVELLKQKPDEELAYCKNLLERDNHGLSNYSAYHYRSAMLRRKNIEENEAMDALLQREWDLVTNAMFTDADNQSIWIYNRWLLNTMEQDREFVQNELDICQQLLEVEKGKCKWALLTTVICQMEFDLNARQVNELLTAIDKLIELDPMRTGYYCDIKSDFLHQTFGEKRRQKIELEQLQTNTF